MLLQSLSRLIKFIRQCWRIRPLNINRIKVVASSKCQKGEFPTYLRGRLNRPVRSPLDMREIQALAQEVIKSYFKGHFRPINGIVRTHRGNNRYIYIDIPLFCDHCRFNSDPEIRRMLNYKLN